MLAGLLVWLTPLGSGLGRLSYDLLFLFKPAVRPEGVVIVYMDEKSFRELGQQPSSWDRSLHAQLLERMTQDRARAVVFDIWFTDPGSPASNEKFRQAIKNNGRVILAATLSSDTQPGLNQKSLLKPLPIFCDVAANCGIADFTGQRQSVVRQVQANSELGPGLAWAAAAFAGELGQNGPLSTKGREGEGAAPTSYWLNYYGPQGTLPSISYCDVTNQPPGYFRDKAVFVGAHPKTLYAFEESDEFNTPHSRWGGAHFPGVEIQATAFLNLERHETLSILPSLMQFLIVVASGLLLGWGLGWLRPALSAGLAGSIALAFFLAAFALHMSQHLWFPWLVVVAAQVPSVFAWNLGSILLKARPVSNLSPFPTFDGKGRVPNVPDHTLLARIGAGAYGEVWLAENTIGMFRAVKYAFRDRYSSPAPYLREFRGIENYMPISLNHPWLVHVLHVGRNDAGGYFFYIMEAGDDEVSGSKIDPAHYTPRDLAKELRRRGKLPVAECVSLGLQLSKALDHLHRNGLIHRDIKPANIIFIAGIPKLADIGLVTEMDRGKRTTTYVGTEGYIPPEGPGTAGADVYSLGKVLYEISMGRDRLQYPQMPTSIVGLPGPSDLLQLHEIILKACENNPATRYQSAAELHADLARLQQRLGLA